MSKKIWRGQAKYNLAAGGFIHTGDKPTDCTVLPDSACFPVKEAMALCKAVVEWYELEEESTELDAAQYRMGVLHDRYFRAVERMKKKQKGNKK